MESDFDLEFLNEVMHIFENNIDTGNEKQCDDGSERPHQWH